MNRVDRRSGAELHTLTGAYALHALPDAERGEFERHLGDCEACAMEVRELSETATRLGLAVSAAPPRELRDRVLREITTVRQESPSHSRRSRSALRPTGPQLAEVRTRRGCGCRCRVRRDRGVAEPGRPGRTAGGAPGTAAERAGGAGPHGPGREDEVRHAEGRGEGHGRGFAEREPGRVRDLGDGAAPSGKVYQLWFDDGGTMRSAGLMNRAATSNTVLLDGPVDGASGIGVTVEPAGGSAQPTSAPLALLTFPTA